MFPVTDVNNQPKLQFPSPFPQTFASFHKISKTTYKEVKTSKKQSWRVFSAFFQESFPLFILFTGILGFFQALDIKEFLTICTLTATRWHWPAAPLSTLENFCQRTKVTFADRNVPPQLALLFFDIFFLFSQMSTHFQYGSRYLGLCHWNYTRETMMLGFYF